MIIQTRALSGGVVLPNCPYGGCGGACPSCARALAIRRYAPAMQGFGGYSTPGAFGALSFTVPEHECDVSLYDGKPNGWEGWCDCMFAASDPNRAKCRKKPCGVWWDTNPDCVFGLPNLVWAPWTEIGAGARGIPKRGGGLLYLFASGFAPVEPYELEADYFFSLVVTNPLRATYVLSHYGEGLAKAKMTRFNYAIPVQALEAMYLALSVGTAGVLQNIPLAGGVITTAVAMVLFATAGIASWPILIPVAWAYSLAKDPSGDRFNTYVVDPAWNALGDITALVASVGTLMAGDPEGLAKLVSVLCRRAAKMLPATGAADVEVARALLNAAAKSSTLIVRMIKDPKAAFTKEGTYAQIGGVLKDISTVAAKAGNGPLATALLVYGDVYEKLDLSMTKVALAITTGDTEQYLCCGPNTAFDLLPMRYLGFTVSGLEEIARNLEKSGAATSAELNKAAYGSPNAKAAMQALQDGLNAVGIFAREIDKALQQIGPVGKFFLGVIEKLLAEKARLDALLDATRAPDPAGSILDVAGLPRLNPGLRLTRPGELFPVLPKDRFVTKEPAASPLVPVLLGAGAGFLVAGPPGALIGGGGAIFLSKK